MPSEDGQYLTYTPGYTCPITTLYYCAARRMFFYDADSPETTHWMELPEEPEEA